MSPGQKRKQTSVPALPAARSTRTSRFQSTSTATPIQPQAAASSLSAHEAEAVVDDPDDLATDVQMAPPDIILWCIVKDTSSAFKVSVSMDENVGRLKKEIKKEKANKFKDCDADDLTLFKSSLNRLSSAVSKLSNPDLFLKPLTPNHINIIVHGPSKAHKFAVDISTRLSVKWNVPLPAILDVPNIGVYLDAPLDPEEKIPISDMEWQLLLRPDLSLPGHFCTPEDLGILFTKTEDETASFICRNVLVAIHRAQPDASGTEDSFHAFWDRNILEILVTCLGQPKWIRNGNQGTHTGSLRPDLGLLLQSACVFRGEEKKPMFTGTHPRKELAHKTRWVYDPAPYVLGYYAVGADVTLVAIQPSADTQGKEQIVIKDIVRADLSTRRGRIKNTVRMIRLVKLLRALERIIAKDVDIDMLPMNRDDGKSIEFFKTKIRKTYGAEDSSLISLLKSLYGHLEAKGVPNVDHLTRSETSHPEYGCFVELEPRGINTGPTSASDVTNAVISILEALKVLHAPEPQIFHRDIRWPNVMQSITDPKKWFLIDWEDAAIAPTKAALNLCAETHAPWVFEDGHGAEVDIWGVGRLIATASVFDLSENLRSLGWRMVDGSVVSAEQGLTELKSL